MDVPRVAGPMTRLTSRAWNWNAIRAPGSVAIEACRETFHVPVRSQELSGSCGAALYVLQAVDATHFGWVPPPRLVKLGHVVSSDTA